MGDKKRSSLPKQPPAGNISEADSPVALDSLCAEHNPAQDSASHTSTTHGDTIARPEPAHLPPGSTRDAQRTGPVIDAEPVATASLNDGEGASFEHDVAELREYDKKPGSTSKVSHPSELVALPVRDSRLKRDHSGWTGAVLRFWKRQVSLSVDHESCRDHLALERTFLGYVRTSLALSFTGVTVAQLFRLDDTAKSDSKNIYYLGRGMSSMFIGGSMVVVTLGGWRFWRQQNALVRGKIHAGGFEVYLTMFLVFSIVVLMFAVVLGIDRFKPKDGS